MAFLEQARDYYRYILDDKSDPRVKGWLMMDSPVPLMVVLALYYYFIKHAGPEFMKNRKPYDLKNIMIVYNTVQCIVNAWATVQGYRFLTHDEYSLACSPVTYSTEPFHMRASYLSYIYFWVKVVDLADTIFMVLRKNFRQVTFLHVYHHMGMAMGSWVVVKFIPGAHLCFVGFVNCLVHTIMYYYYLLTAYDPELKKSIWWKKHITELQLVQFSLILIHHTIALVNPNCTYPRSALLIFISQNFIIVYLFSKFYYENYIKPEKKKSN